MPWRSVNFFRIVPMAHSYKIVGVIALAAAAACSTDATSPDLKATARARADLTAASTNNVVVTESDIARQFDGTPPTRNWVFYIVTPTTTGAFVSGPGNPPLGVGSFEMRTPGPLDHGFLFNYDHVNTRLDEITAISYSTYRAAGQAAVAIQLPSINIEIDMTGGTFVPGDYATLVFEPVYNPTQGPVLSGIWQDWYGIPGLWWATRDIGGISARVPVLWSEILAAIPNATILGGFGVNQGSGSTGLIASTDALSIAHNGNSWTYNFEPFRSKKDCKRDGRNDARGDDGKCKKNKKDKNENSDED
jgi:hypothetical protein